MNTRITKLIPAFFHFAIAWLMTVGMVTVAQADECLSSCPFCSAINLTFAEQIGSNDVVAIATMIEAPRYEKPDGDELPKAKFEIDGLVKGAAFAKPGMKFNAILVGSYEVGQKFIVMGVDPPNVVWSTPLKASQRVIDYVQALQKLPNGGADRLNFFQDYFEDAESILAFDAYDEFARAPYADLIDLKDRMRREQIIKWIQDPEIAVNRRRLYFTMLGVCGTEADIPMLEEMIKSGDRQKQAGLDALVGCYMVLKGESALPLIEKQLLEKEDVDYVDTLSAVSAIRFMGTESKQIPRERLCESLRTLLKRPTLADMIVPDLARWEDWSVMDKLVELFKDAKGDTVWLRVAIFQYLQVCPLPAAKEHIKELAKIDPKAHERASFFSDFGASSDSGTTDLGIEIESIKNPETPDSADKNESGDDDLGEDDSEFHPVATARVIPELLGQVQFTATTANSVSQNVQTPTESSEPFSESEIETGKEPDGKEDGGETLSTFKPALDPAPANAAPANAAPTNTAPTNANSTTSPVPSVVEPEIAASPAPAPASSATVPLAPVSRFYSLMLPVGSGMAIFLLLWSVINGWFERLIF